MTVVFRRELSSYFKGLVGYFFAASILVLGGLFCYAYNLNASSASFETVLGNMTFIYLIIVPILSMRVIAEERRHRTDQLLYSLPTSMTKVVLGKYLAMVAVLLLPILIMAFYPLILSAYGTVNMAAAYGNLLAFYLLGATLLSIGMFVSSLTESQILAAGLCFVVILIDFFLAGLASMISTSAPVSLVALLITVLVLGFILWLLTRNTLIAGVFTGLCAAGLALAFVLARDSFNGLFGSVMNALCVFTRTQDFTNGVFNLVSIVYYLAVTAVFLFLTVQSMEKRRWS
jgi:ABC-2 type transport system permease protein